MPYCDVTDVQDAITRENLVSVAGGETPDTIDEEKVQRFILRADSVINSVLGGIYSNFVGKYLSDFDAELPEDYEIPYILKHISSVMAGYYLTQATLNQEVNDGASAIEKRFADVTTILDRIKSKDFAIDLEPDKIFRIIGEESSIDRENDYGWN